MTVNLSPARTAYFREINNKEEGIELKYSLTMPQGVFLELVVNGFRKAISQNSGFVVMTASVAKQEFFTKLMMDRYRGDLYSEEEMDLGKIMLKIMKKSQKQVNYELDLFDLKAEKRQETVIQEIAKAKCYDYEKLYLSVEVLTIRQAKHLVALVDSFGRRTYRCKGYYTVT